MDSLNDAPVAQVVAEHRRPLLVLRIQRWTGLAGEERRDLGVLAGPGVVLQRLQPKRAVAEPVGGNLELVPWDELCAHRPAW
jgi:hypothetical protein